MARKAKGAYAVNIGYHVNGRAKTCYFQTLEKAREYCAGYFESSGIVLSIVAVSA